MKKNRIFQVLASIAVITVCVSGLADDRSVRRGSRQTPNPRLKEKTETLEGRLLKDGNLSISIEASSSSQSSAEATGEGFSASSHEGQDERLTSGNSGSNRKSATRNRADSKAKAKAEAKAKSQIGVKIQLGRKTLPSSQAPLYTANQK